MSKTIIDIFKRKYASFVYRMSLRNFRFFERLGVHVTPVHFYSPIPDTRQYGASLFSREFPMDGVNLDAQGQLSTLSAVYSEYVEEFTPYVNTGLSLADSFVLYCMIRHYKPRQMVEVGAGETTKISLLALERNLQDGHEYTFTSIEPYPREDLLDLDNPRFRLIAKKVEMLDVSFFAETDMLFIDSSHVSRLGSDVNFEILEVVPSLKKGAVVHWHDITIPTNYWQDWAHDGNKFWNESYMLHAFLLFNDAFRVVWASRYMFLKHEKELKRYFPFMKDDERCTSFWLFREK